VKQCFKVSATQPITYRQKVNTRAVDWMGQKTSPTLSIVKFLASSSQHNFQKFNKRYDLRSDSFHATSGFTFNLQMTDFKRITF